MLFPHLILSEGGIEMGSMVCMNELCRSTTSSEWKKGWALKSGGFVKLCYNCGSLFENLVFCETFHPEESGWRECRTCRKRIHCGCIASKCLYDYLDYGGVACINCTSHLDGQSISPIQVPGDDFPNGSPGTKSAQLLGVENKTEENNNFEKKRIIRFSKPVDPSETAQPFQTQKNDTNASPGNVKQEIMLPLASSLFVKPENEGPGQGVKDVFGSINQPSLHFSLSTNSCDAEGREQSKNSPFHQGQRTRHILPKPPKHSPSPGSESKKEMASQTRVPRPPAEGRGGRNQLLPRYWPRITDQELQKISGDLKSTIVPLFEKVLSASDAGRIGRLVLPKACAEAYFPPINQSEGLPIRIQDIKGKEWTFQFRFWPNNNSRMYVLEGVTPCIQNMQLQAGDTVIFSRIDPGGKLVMGFRKATNNGDMQETQTSNLPNGSGYSETSFSGTAEILMNGCRISDDSVRQVSISEKKKARNIGSKSKRLIMNADDAMELRITWEEAQELLRPPPATKPTIVMIEDYEFEEYDEPPVFGKKTIFTARSSGVDQEQWAQCDSCSKWRRLPVHVLLPAKWTCSDNMWDPRRCSCGAPDEINPRELEAFYRVSKDQKRRKIVESNEDCEPTGLDALAALAVLGDNMGELGESSVGATTKHPRHRPGCTCIVCIQPPSGKGKHQPMCKCNVCLTVKRRFKTLMLRKKKKQSEREAQAKDQADAASGTELLKMNAASENEQMNQSEIETDQLEEFGPGKGQLDLNCDPSRDDDVALAATAGMSITSLVTAADLPLEYLGQNGLETLGNSLLSQAPGETSEGHHPGEASEGHYPGETSEGHHPDNGFVKSADAEHHENRC